MKYVIFVYPHLLYGDKDGNSFKTQQEAEDAATPVFSSYQVWELTDTQEVALLSLYENTDEFDDRWADCESEHEGNSSNVVG